MAIANHFYNGLTRKYVAIFGTLFNQLTIERSDNAGVTKQSMIVPISYAPMQKILSRVEQDPGLNRRSAITLPRMSFEMTSMSYDGERKIGTTQRVMKSKAVGDTNDSKSYVYSGAPYNLEFSLYIMTKYQEDATKILEQILPFFQPDWTVSARLIPDLPPVDVPIVLQSVITEDLYEGEYTERRAILYTLGFTLKGWYYGPERTKKVIKFIDTKFAPDSDISSPLLEKVTLQPGMTAANVATTDINQTVPYTEIDFEDDWGIITIIDEEDT